MSLYAEIIEAEEALNALLPVSRLKDKAPAALINAAHRWSDTVWAAAGKRGPIPLSKQQVETGLTLAQHPVFICGVHRSGTTLLRDMLDAHPELLVLPSEGTFYTNIEAKLNAIPDKERMEYIGKEWLRRLANPINQAPYWLLGRTENDKSVYVDFACYVIAWWDVVDKTNPQWPHQVIMLAYASCLNKLNGQAWVDKTPVNERYLKRIWAENPQAKVIQLIRNPVDVISSRKKMEPSIPLRKAMDDLELSFKMAHQQLKDSHRRFLLVRYEDICDKTEETIEQIASYLNIPVSPQLFIPTIVGKPTQANSSFANNHPQGKILSLKQPETILSKTDTHYIAARLDKLINQLGYVGMSLNLFYKYWLRLAYLLKHKSVCEAKCL